MADDLPIKPGDRFLSNHGKGPLAAECVSVSAGIARLFRFQNDLGVKAERVYFEYPVAFFSSPICGWVLIGSSTEHGVREDHHAAR